MKLLVVEDDQLLGRSLVKGLREADYAVDWAQTGDEGWHLMRSGDYDGIVLDWMLPGIAGIDILRRYRAGGGQTPILLLTARDTSADTVRGLDSGADDYLVKPFDFGVLLARLRSLVRRGYGKREPVLRIADLELDQAKREVRRGGEPIDLTPREFMLLELLALRANQVVTRTEIWNKLYETDNEGTSNTVDAYISYLRRKIDHGRPPLIVTRRGHGYMLRGEPCDPPSDDES